MSEFDEQFGHKSSASLWNRLKLAWNLLCNRPTAYRIFVEGLLMAHDDGIMVYNSTIRGKRSDETLDGESHERV